MFPFHCLASAFWNVISSPMTVRPRKRHLHYDICSIGLGRLSDVCACALSRTLFWDPSCTNFMKLKSVLDHSMSRNMTEQTMSHAPNTRPCVFRTMDCLPLQSWSFFIRENFDTRPSVFRTMDCLLLQSWSFFIRENFDTRSSVFRTMDCLPLQSWSFFIRENCGNVPVGGYYPYALPCLKHCFCVGSPQNSHHCALLFIGELEKPSGRINWMALAALFVFAKCDWKLLMRVVLRHCRIFSVKIVWRLEKGRNKVCN
jgi:hypothetical protein